MCADIEKKKVSLSVCTREVGVAADLPEQMCTVRGCQPGGSAGQMDSLHHLMKSSDSTVA